MACALGRHVGWWADFMSESALFIRFAAQALAGHRWKGSPAASIAGALRPRVCCRPAARLHTRSAHARSSRSLLSNQRERESAREEGEGEREIMTLSSGVRLLVGRSSRHDLLGMARDRAPSDDHLPGSLGAMMVFKLSHPRSRRLRCEGPRSCVLSPWAPCGNERGHGGCLLWLVAVLVDMLGPPPSSSLGAPAGPRLPRAWHSWPLVPGRVLA